MEEKLTTLQKALAINLDECKYGTIAEIGAGQEIARLFFQAGGAAGSIAKTMSAYDMQFSNAIYGQEESKRYVCRSRVIKMLDHEYQLLVERLSDIRPKNSTFFALADTVAAKGFKSNRECHGWMGVRLQLYPGAAPSEIHIHVRMLDNSNYLQAGALGILGVNLIYGAYYYYREPEKLIDSLMDSVGRKRIEIDMIDFSGPYFEEVDNRLMSLHLVREGITNAIMFSNKGNTILPAETFYKKNVLIARGSFRPYTKVNHDLIECSKSMFYKEGGVTEKNSLVITEITIPKLKDGKNNVDEQDFLARVDILNELGYTVMISEYLLFSRLRAYINRYTKRKIRIALGVPNIHDIFDEKYYGDFEGGLLEVFGKLFTGNTKLYVYPHMDQKGELETAENLHVPEHLKHLYQHLYRNEYIVPLECYTTDLMQYQSRSILKQLKSGDGPWKEGVPESVYKAITTNRLFGFNTE